MAQQIITKRCSHCNQTKAISEFWRCRSQRDGFANQCKVCHGECVMRYSLTAQGIETARRCARKYINTEKGKQKRQRYACSQTGKKAQRRADHKYCAANPEKRHAKDAVHHAIIAGRLFPASRFTCVQCGKKAQQYHHRNGYDKQHWFDVIPLCRLCHKKLHYKTSPISNLSCLNRIVFI